MQQIEQIHLIIACVFFEIAFIIAGSCGLYFAHIQKQKIILIIIQTILLAATVVSSIFIFVNFSMIAAIVCGSTFFLLGLFASISASFKNCDDYIEFIGYVIDILIEDKQNMDIVKRAKQLRLQLYLQQMIAQSDLVQVRDFLRKTRMSNVSSDILEEIHTKVVLEKIIECMIKREFTQQMLSEQVFHQFNIHKQVCMTAQNPHMIKQMWQCLMYLYKTSSNTDIETYINKQNTLHRQRINRINTASDLSTAQESKQVEESNNELDVIYTMSQDDKILVSPRKIPSSQKSRLETIQQIIDVGIHEQNEEADAIVTISQRLKAQIISFFIIIVFSTIDVIILILNQTQFFILCGLNKTFLNLDNWFYLIPNVIYYNNIQKWATPLGLGICVVMVIFCQALTDYTLSDASQKEDEKEIFYFSTKITVIWNSCFKGKNYYQNLISVQKTFQKLTLTILRILQTYLGLIMIEYGTLLIANCQTLNEYVDILLIFIIIIFQIFESKYFSMLIQIFNLFKSGCSTLIVTKFFFSFATIVQIVMTAFFTNFFVPYEFVCNMFGLHNNKMEEARNFFFFHHQSIKVVINICVMCFLLSMLTIDMTAISITFTFLIAFSIVFNLLILIPSRLQKYLLKFQYQALEKNCDIEVTGDMPSIWQNYLLSQKLQKYAAVPYVGSLIGNIATFMNGPAYIIQSERNSLAKYFINFMQIVLLIVLTIFYGMAGKSFYIAANFLFILFLLLIAVDVWEDAGDFLNCEPLDLYDYILSKCKKTEEEMPKTSLLPERATALSRQMQQKDNIDRLLQTAHFDSLIQNEYVLK